MGSTICTVRVETTSTASGTNTSHRSAVAPRAVSGGGVAVVGPELMDALHKAGVKRGSKSTAALRASMWRVFFLIWLCSLAG